MPALELDAPVAARGSALAVARGVVLERRPRDRIVTVPEAEESAEAHHGVRNAAGNFLDEQVVDFADRLLANAIDAGALDVLAGMSR